MSDEADKEQMERFILKRRRGYCEIHRQYIDPDFGDPPFWVAGEKFGPFKDQEAARQFMIERYKVNKGGDQS